MKKRIEVVGAVLTDGDLVFAARRGEGHSLAGLWEFPGGKIEKGETPEEALRRELVEELECHASVGKHIETTEYEYDFGVVVLSTFYCTVDSSQPVNTEHAELKWLPASELHTLEWAPADIPAVDHVVADFAS